MSRLYFIITFLLAATADIFPSHSIFIIIHGTWGLETTWYTPGGDFFDALEQTAQQMNAAVTPFCWSGHNSNKARNKAAHNLAKLLATYDENTNVILVGHSHGGTVALLASHLLTKINKYQYPIKTIYTLGMPINRYLYPNMDTIEHCYNLFSFEDLIQPVLGMFGREHQSHARIANIRVFIHKKEPDHSTLHHEIIGKWLPHIDQQFIHFLSTHLNNSTMSEPSIIYFDNTRPPRYALDIKRKDLIEKDHQLSLLILNSLRKSFKIESNIPLINL